MVTGKGPKFGREDGRRTDKSLNFGIIAGMVTGKGPSFGREDGRRTDKQL